MSLRFFQPQPFQDLVPPLPINPWEVTSRLSPAEGLRDNNEVSMPCNSSSLLQELSVAFGSSVRNQKSPINLPMWHFQHCRGSCRCRVGMGAGGRCQGWGNPWNCALGTFPSTLLCQGWGLGAESWELSPDLCVCTARIQPWQVGKWGK